MSILACLIGILTLMISVITQAKQMERQGRTEEETKRALLNRDLTRQAEDSENTIKALDERLRKEKSTTAELAQLEDRKIVLKITFDEIAKARDAENSDLALQKQVENLKNEIAALKAGRPALEERMKTLQTELENRHNPPPPVESVVIRPGGTGRREAFNLFFVECNSTGIVLLSGDGAPKPVPLATIDKSPDYNAFLDTVKATRDSMIVFLLRKAGNESYRWGAGWAESQYSVRTGKLPVPNEGKIDLTHFQK
jgi:chaperonin cofactor prefoldin